MSEASQAGVMEQYRLMNQKAHNCNLCKCISELDHYTAQRQGIDCACEQPPSTTAERRD